MDADMDADVASTPWTDPDWRDAVYAWIAAQLDDLHLTPAGAITQPHVRPWSTVLVVPVVGGRVYFKATASSLRHEPALTAALSGWRPDCMPEVLACDVARGWMLLADGGDTLRSRIQSADDLWHWETILPRYAEVQIELAPRAAELLALGALDRRLAGLPGQVVGLLADTAMLRVGAADGLSAAQLERLHALMPGYARLCAELAAAGLPETLHHEDFHDANILVRDGRYTFFDWGESGVAHPFFTLLVTLRSIAYRLDLDPDGPEIARLRDAYLEPWTRYAPLEALRPVAALAQRAAMPARALTWHRVLVDLGEAERAQDADAVPGWLEEYLEAEASAAG